MKNKLHYSPEALKDLDEIWEYIMSDLGNPSAAESVVNRIMDTIDKLEDFAEMGTPFSSVIDMETDYRYLLSGNYTIFYRTDATDVYVDRILYGKRDYLRILFPDLPGERE